MSEDLGAKLDALIALVERLLETVEGALPPAERYCPPETIAQLAKRTGAKTAEPSGRVVCPGGMRLRRHAQEYAGTDPARAADRLWHRLPEDARFRASFAGQPETEVRNHNVWRSRSLSREEVLARGLTPVDPLDDGGEPEAGEAPEPGGAGAPEVREYPPGLAMDPAPEAPAPEREPPNAGWLRAKEEYLEAARATLAGAFGGDRLLLKDVYSRIPAMYPLLHPSRLESALIGELRAGTELMRRGLEVGPGELLDELGVARAPAREAPSA